MIIFLLTLFLYFLLCEAQYFFDTTPIRMKNNSLNGEAIYYTTGTKSDPSSKIFSASYLSRESNTGLAFMKYSENDTTCGNTVCPKLVKFQTKLIKKCRRTFTTQFVERAANETGPTNIAGYLAPTPGYCGATGEALMELYSAHLKSYKVSKASTLEDVTAISHDPQRYQITRFLGYYFPVGKKLPLCGTAPHFIDPSVTEVRRTFHPLLEIYRFKSKTGDKYTYTAISDFVEKLSERTSLFEFDTASLRLLKYNNLIATARVKCGATSYVYEVYDNTNDISRLSLKTKLNPTDKTLGLAGLSLKNASVSCGFIYEAVEYQNKKNPAQFIISTSVDAKYSTSADWTISQRLGFVRMGSLLLSLPV